MKKIGYITVIAAAGITALSAGIMGAKNVVFGISDKIAKKKKAKAKISENKKTNEFDSNRFKDDVLYTIVDGFEKKTPYSRGHSKRVADISKALGEKLNIKDLDGLYYAALLHDVGKLFLPDEIISKSKLNMTESERTRWYDHPKSGAKFVKSINGLSEYAEAIEHHHERYDGSGYPDSLSGDEIPIFSRIIGVADAYEAMSSERSGREAYPREYIIREFNKCSGKQFDPLIVKAMMSVIADISI